MTLLTWGPHLAAAPECSPEPIAGEVDGELATGHGRGRGKAYSREELAAHRLEVAGWPRIRRSGAVDGLWRRLFSG